MYVGLEDVVECGVVVVAELSNFSFIRVSRMSGLLRSSGLRQTSDLFRSSGAWAKIGLGKMNCENSGKKKMVRSKSSDLVDGKGWGGWGKLDPHATTQIHGPNPTKSQLTNKSQKKIGAIFGGEFSELGRKQQNQARKHGVGAPKT